MGVAYVIVAVLSAAVAVFALQNNQTMSLRFIAWSLDGIPLAGAILASLAAGFIIAAVPFAFSSFKWRRRARALEARVETLEAAARPVRESAVLTPRPGRPPGATRSA